MKNLRLKITTSITVSMLLLVCVFTATAQKAEIGIRFMPTFTALDINTSSGGTVKGEVTLGYGIGGILGYNFSHYIGVQGEVIYSAISQKYKEEDTERKLKLKYVNIPLLLSLNTGKTNMINLNVVAGPQLGISVGSRFQTTTSDSANAVVSIKKGDLGFAYGAGLDFALNPSHRARFSFGYRGVVGLIDISDHSRTISTNSYYIFDRTHIKTNSIYVGVSVLF